MAKNEIKVIITGDPARFKTALGSADASLNRFGGQVDAHGTKWDGLKSKLITFGKVAAVAVGAAAIGAAKWGLDAARAAGDYGESLNKLNVLIGGESTDMIVAWAEQNVKSLGMSKKAAVDAAGTYSLFADAAGLSGDQSRFFTQSLVQLTADMGSFNNASIEETTEAIGAALRGESEPIRRFGVLLDDATLKQRYFAMTGEEVTGSLTPQQKTMAAYGEIIAQTTKQQGDFARTQDSLPNRLKQVEAQYENLRIQVGEKLLPILVELLDWFVEDAWPWLETNIPKWKKWWDDTIVPIIDRTKAFGQAVQFWFEFVGAKITDLFIKVALFKARMQDLWRQITDVVRNAGSTIGFVAAGIGNWVANMRDRITGAISGAIGSVFGLAASFGGLIGAVASSVSNVIGWVVRVPGAIFGAFAGAGSWLVSAGRAIMDGLLAGLRAAWEKVAGFVGGIADKIKNLKGPLAKDRLLLVQEGQAIMGGLGAGIRGGLQDVEQLVAGIAPSISATVTATAPATPAVAVPAGGGTHLHFHGPVARDSVAWVKDQIAEAQRRGV